MSEPTPTDKEVMAALVAALADTITGFERCMRSVKIQQEFIDIKLEKAKAALALAEAAP